MFRIGRMPRSCKRFFESVREHFSDPAWRHFWMLSVGMMLGTAMSVDRLAALLEGGTHRTKHGEFLWRSQWDEAAVLRGLSSRALRCVRARGAGAGRRTAYLIFDDTAVAKRGRLMDAVSLVRDCVHKRWINGHLIVKAAVHFCGVTVPWATQMYVKREDARRVGVPFLKRTDMVAQMIAAANLDQVLPGVRIVVLFDAFYLCRTIIKAVENRGWTWISIAKRNRRFTPEGGHRSSVLSTYGRNLLRRAGHSVNVTGLRLTHTYRLAERIGFIPKVGKVKLVVNRRRRIRSLHLLVSNDLRSSAQRLLADYLQRWSIEVLIKEHKQHLGLGAYRVRRYRAMMRHLHLADCAHTCLTHVWLRSRRDHGVSSPATTTVLRVPPLNQLRSALRQEMWQQTLQEVIAHTHERPVIRRLERLLAA